MSDQPRSATGAPPREVAPRVPSVARPDSAAGLAIIPAATPPTDATPPTADPAPHGRGAETVGGTLPLASDSERIPAGTVLGGRYEVGKHLGSGGMGTVYAAHDRLLDTPCALKFVRPQLASSPREQSRLRREVRLAQTITHINVIRTFTLEQQDGHLFIVMELLDGVSLADRLRGGPLPLAEALRVTRDVLAGLAAAHAKSIIHRDIKPQNTKLCSDGRVVVMDFGIARAAQLDAPPTPGVEAAPAAPAAGPHTVLAGTPGYIAPEVLAGAPATAVSDLYAVGVLLHQMIEGKRPYDQGTLSVQVDTVASPPALEPPVLTSLPPRLAALTARLLVPDPAQRFSSVAEVVRALDALDAPAAVTAPAAPPARTRWWLPVGGVAGVAAIAIAASGVGGGGARIPRVEVPVTVTAPVTAPGAAPVTGSATVTGSAPVTGSATVTGSAPVTGSATVTEPVSAPVTDAQHGAPVRRTRRAPARTTPAVAAPAIKPAAAPAKPAPDDAAARRRKLLDLNEE